MNRLDKKMTKALDAFLNAEYEGCSKDVLLDIKSQLESYLGTLNYTIKMYDYEQELKALKNKYGIITKEE